ncbi:hypothetical protein [Nocardia sp. NPDC050710]|uniref:hypothetical protein n=1 Tax=Nocardia sp. NPDC050710 TaxID=3157220 RepID=UPI0033ED0016
MVTYSDSVIVDPAVPQRMPEPVREAREAALGLAGFGIVYPVILGLTVGGSAAAAGAVQFAPGWLLGLAVLGFGTGAVVVRRAAIVLAALQIIVGTRIAGITDLGVVPVLTVFYAWGTSAAVIHLLRQPHARAWFAGRGR